MKDKAKRNAREWRAIHYAIGAVWAAIGVWGIISLAFLGTQAFISSVPLIFVASMWANMMMHFQKAQQFKIEDEVNGKSE